jgi:hypothetical protein
MRNILEPAGLSRRAQEILSLPPKKWDAGARKLVATALATDMVLGQWGDDEDEEDEGGGDDAGSPLKTLEDDLHTYMLDRVKKRVRQEMSQEEMEEALTPESPASDAPNDTLIKEGHDRAFRTAMDMVVRTAASDAHAINAVASINQSIGIDIPVQMYRAVLAAGRYTEQDPRPFLRACQRALGRQPTIVEAKTMVRLGKLISRRGAATMLPSPLRGEKAHPGSSQGDKR